MSVYSFSREGSVFSVASTYGSSRATSVPTEAPEDPFITKERKKLYKIGKKYQKPDEDQLIMFDPSVIHFYQWKAKFDRLLESREIEDEETKKELLFKALPSHTMAIIPKLFDRLVEPMEKDSAVILNKLLDYHNKLERRDRIKARIKFFSTKQGETNFYQFANSLRDQLFDCDFGAFEEDALVLAFVTGLSNPILRKHMLEKELWLSTLIDSVELALKFQDVLPSEYEIGSAAQSLVGSVRSSSVYSYSAK